MSHHDWIPRTVKQALSCGEPEQYNQALNLEIDSLLENEAFEVVKRPSNKHLLGCKTIFSKEYDQHGNLDRYKCRIVALGNHQIEGIEYHDTYAPVIDKVSVKVFLSMAASMGLRISQFDVKTAFLYGKLDEEVYMELLPT